MGAVSDERNTVGIIADGASAKAFLLKGEALVEHLPAVLRGDAEVEEAEILLAIQPDEVVEEEVERTQLAPSRTGGYILRMDNGSHLEEERARHNAAVLADSEEADVGRVVADEAADFFERMHGGHLMAAAQGLAKDLPECWQVVQPCVVHDVAAFSLGALHFTAAQGGKSHAFLLQGHGLRGGARREPSAQAVYPVQFLLSGQGGVNLRNGFDDEGLCSLLLVMGKDFAKHFAHLHEADARQ